MPAAADFPLFFSSACGPDRVPYDYQKRLACGEAAGRTEDAWLTSSGPCASQLISVPTGLGKTAAVVLAWLWNRVHQQSDQWPRRLVYCLPMRTLVEQTRDEAKKWIAELTKAGLIQGEPPKVHILMGGEETEAWDFYPEKNAILIGTQDMLLSRALNRGYGMSRYRWPMHFGLLNNDCLWVLDETQLMGPGLWTAGQLDWMRQHRFGVLKPCFTWWMSATPSPVFLDTPDRQKDGFTTMPVIEVGNDPAALVRLNPTRPLSFWKASAPTPKAKKKAAAPTLNFSDSLAAAIRSEHIKGTLSLVVCNSVKAAQELYRSVGTDNAILLTSRFRRGDRADHTRRLLAFETARKEAAKQNPKDDTVPDSPGLICIATQVIEAGVDISSRRLWMEAAPWPSALQRLGRLNRDGSADEKAQAFVFEWPSEGKKGKAQPVGPYEVKDIEASVKLLTKLASIYVSELKLGAKAAMEKLDAYHGKEIETALKPKDEEFPRAMDVHGLFSTEPDVFGGFTDVSPWVRGSDKNADATVFWRDFEAKKGPGKTEALTGPSFDTQEGCAVAIHRLREFLDKVRAHVWDERNEQWQSLRPDDLRPGMVVMLPRSAGGYSEQLGWTGKSSDQLSKVEPPGRFDETFEEDGDSENAGWVPLDVHLADAKSAATQIAEALALDSPHSTALITAAELHDIGKAHPIWQKALPHSVETEQELWAKAPHVLVLQGKKCADYRQSTEQLLTSAGVKAIFYGEEIRDEVPRQIWKVSEKIRDTRSLRLLSEIKAQGTGLEAWMRRFCPSPLGWKTVCIRHEAASMLAAWPLYFKGGSEWPALTLFLIACHHGKVRTVLYARGEDGQDVCGVPNNSDPLPWNGGLPMDFACAAVGTSGEFSDDGLSFIPSSYGWTGLVADLLGGWEKTPSEIPEPLTLHNCAEPRLLGPFKLAYLESLICVADIRASKNPSDLRHV